MQLIARLDGREERLEVRRQGEVFLVDVGERSYEVDVERLSHFTRSLVIAGEQHEVVVRALGRGRYQVASARGLCEVEVVDPLTHLARQAGQSAGTAGARTTSAYMPGRVVELLVEVGDVVKAGQGVVVLEAMKMENEIQAERDGVVRRFFVERDQPVESGDPLFEVD